jgi:hypothetical protein
LPNGKVLIASGVGIGDTTSAELYDEASGTWSETASLTRRSGHTSTLLPNGKVLVAGGDYPSYLASAELYDVGLRFSNDWQPKISDLKLDRKRLFLTGSLFQGISQASGGNTQDSSTNYPIVQLRSIDNSQVVFLPVDPPMAGRTQASPLCPCTIFLSARPGDHLYQRHSEQGEVVVMKPEQ